MRQVDLREFRASLVYMVNIAEQPEVHSEILSRKQQQSS